MYFHKSQMQGSPAFVIFHFFCYSRNLPGRNVAYVAMSGSGEISKCLHNVEYRSFMLFASFVPC